ncbi:MAG TPA: thioesterase family protein [Tetragenococcus sp.]|nr:thioesterase family protein [Tetragenococcus sp.]
MYPGLKRKPHYYETDQMGIVHHSNYIRWFEEARVDLLEYLDLPYQKMEAAGLLVPVLEVNCQYKDMVYYGDPLTIQVEIEKYKASRLNFSYKIYKENRLVTNGNSKHCFLAKKDNKLIDLKKVYPDFHQIFNNYYKNNG